MLSLIDGETGLAMTPNHGWFWDGQCPCTRVVETESLDFGIGANTDDMIQVSNHQASFETGSANEDT
jgi:hypothetical protein